MPRYDRTNRKSLSGFALFVPDCRHQMPAEELAALHRQTARPFERVTDRPRRRPRRG